MEPNIFDKIHDIDLKKTNIEKWDAKQFVPVK